MSLLLIASLSNAFIVNPMHLDCILVNITMLVSWYRDDDGTIQLTWL